MPQGVADNTPYLEDEGRSISLDLVVNSAPTPTLGISFSPAYILPNGVSTLTVVIANAGNSPITLTENLDITLPGDMTVYSAATLEGSILASLFTVTTGSNVISLAVGAPIPAGGAGFSIQVTAIAPAAPQLVIAPNALQTTAGNNAIAATQRLIVTNVSAVSAFSPTAISPTGTSTLTITLGNQASTEATLTNDFVVTLPAGVTLVNTSFGGTFPGVVAGTTGGSTITYGMTSEIPAGGCTITALVTSTTPGEATLTIAPNNLQTSQGGNPVADVETLTVSAISIALDINPSTVPSLIATSLTVTLGNSFATEAVLTSPLIIVFPDGMILSDPPFIEGTAELTSVTAIASGNTITYAAGSVIAAGGANFSVRILSRTLPVDPTTLSLMVGPAGLQTNLGYNSNTATASMIVTASAPAPGPAPSPAPTPASFIPGTMTGAVNWSVPPAGKVRAYNGIVIVVSPLPINPSNYPVDGVRYTPSIDLNSPADMIGKAQVVVARYGDTTTSTQALINLDPDAIYYAAAFVASSIATYYRPGVLSYPLPNTTSNSVYAGDIPLNEGPPLNPISGQLYFDEGTKEVYMWNAQTETWLPTLSNDTLTGPWDPPAYIPGAPTPYAGDDTTEGGDITDPWAETNEPLSPPYQNNFDPYTPPTGLPAGYPRPGDFFYNTREKKLKVWDGSVWQYAETVPGKPMYEKQDVGIVTNSARAAMKDVLKSQLGWPIVCVELNEKHFDIAINNALQEIRRRTDSAYFKQYFFCRIHYLQDVYYMNDPAVGTNKIVDILKIHRLNMLGLVNFAPDNIYAQQFLNQFYAPGVGYDLVSIHLIHSLSNVYSLLFAGDIAYNWRESTRELHIYKRFAREEKVLIEASCEKTEDEILTDRWLEQWVRQWALADCMIMLGRIRGKYSNLPGPGGGLQLNADSLISEGNQLQEDCRRQVADMEVGQQGPDNWNLPFSVG
jgi:hypothetical protein